MTDTCVVVIRTKSNDEILAILSGVIEDKIKIQHPFYARVNPSSGSISMVPYCPLSDEVFFELVQSDIQFVVTANHDVSTRFISLINSIDQVPEIEEDDQIPAASVISGNTTRH